jgi:hypothetical protein
MRYPRTMRTRTIDPRVRAARERYARRYLYAATAKGRRA